MKSVLKLYFSIKHLIKHGLIVCSSYSPIRPFMWSGYRLLNIS